MSGEHKPAPGNPQFMNDSLGFQEQPYLKQSLRSQLNLGSVLDQDLPFQSFASKYLGEDYQGADTGRAQSWRLATSDAVVPTYSSGNQKTRQEGQSTGGGSFFASEAPQGLTQAILAKSHGNPFASSALRSPSAREMSNPPTGGYSSVPFYGPPGRGPPGHAGASPMGSMQMVYGSNPLAYPGQMLPQAPFPVPPLLSPGAIARQQRASADTKRGKRRRPASGAPPPAAGDGAASAQVVPSSAPATNEAPPVAKVKEERRKKRLLRNRVSAQQARERKRQHMQELEDKCQKIEDSNTDLERRINQLTKENDDLRQVVRMNMRSKAGNAGGPQPGFEGEHTIARPRAELARPFDVAAYSANMGMNSMETAPVLDSILGGHSLKEDLAGLEQGNERSSSIDRLLDGSVLSVQGIPGQ